MKRKEKIYNYIKEKSFNIQEEEFIKIGGFSAQQVSEELNILRNNVSKELNELCRESKIIKIKGRPVLYFHRKSLENIFSIKLPRDLIAIEDIDNFIKNNSKQIKNDSPFRYLIGEKTSLKNQVEQAKAAILYPPNGLHTLIIGETGVGKTLFANMMYSYAKYSGRLNEDAPFVVFNCADYYNNPQLLLSHVFGHIKGAFTGADSDKKGVVEKADGGILFLDEIHRLPPEGQEMIFYFMDTGTFNRLGETERNRKANILIIGATTENPASTFLKTFMRRIPITITIPNFEDRIIEDRIDIIKHLLLNEAHRVNKTIKITQECIQALVGNSSYGNIGQIKSTIQLACAKGFLNSINTDKEVEIDLKMFPSDIQNGLISMRTKGKGLESIWNVIPSNLIITPQGYKEIIEDDNYDLPFNLYKIIEDKANILRNEGMEEEYINKFITTDIDIHIKSFYDKLKSGENIREKILRIVDEKTLEFAEEIQQLAENDLGKKYNERLLYAIGLHLSAFFNRKNNSELQYKDVTSIIKNNKKEYEVSIKIKKLIEDRYNLHVSEDEVIHFTLLLKSIQDTKNEGSVGIIVATHGSSTATSMVNVVNKLLGKVNAFAIDMPLEMNPIDILQLMTKKVKEIDRGKGILLLVDMGSLNSFGRVITEETGIEIKTIDMVSTPMVLEAVRKVDILNESLDNIYNYLKNFRGYSGIFENIKDEDEKGVIVTICSSGKGTAIKLKKIIEEIIWSVSKEKIKILSIGLKNLEDDIKEIEKENKILAVVGIINPRINAPFISLENLIGGEGERIIKEIIGGKVYISNDRDSKDIVLKEFCMDNLSEFLTYLNPKKIISVLIQFVNVLEKEEGREFSNSLKIKIIVHTGCALERMMINDSLKYYDKFDKNITFDRVNRCSKIFYEKLKIKLTYDEVCYIAEIVASNI